MLLHDSDIVPPRAAPAPLRVFVGLDEAPVEAVDLPPDGQPSRGHRMHFTLPPATTAIRLVSPLRAAKEDSRQLGVAIQRIEIDGHAVPLDGPAIRDGFYRLEMGGSIVWRWTNGNALIEVPELLDGARLTVIITPWSLPPGPQSARRRVAVVCWDVAHNPVGRAHVLYRLLERDWEPELVGPAFRRFGSGLWPPLRDEGLTLRSFPADSLADVWTEGAILALCHRYDLVVICKPRLPGLVLGLLLAEQSRCPVIVDADESEHAFMEHHGGADASDPASLLSEPFGVLGTALAASLLDIADARTASNPLLQMEHGGHLVRHARDEGAARPDRRTARRRLGFADSDFVVAFVGTIRPHKGLDTVLSAIEALNDPSLRLLLVGPVHDAALRLRLAAQPPGRVVQRDGARMAGLGDLLAAADLVPLMQDPAAGIAQTQVPAKLADALQHGVPVVASDVPPLRDLARRGIVDLIAPSALEGYLTAALSRRYSPDRASTARRVFDGEFGLAVNRVRLEQAIEEAMCRFNPVRRRASDVLAMLRRETRRAARPPQGASAEPAGGQDLVFFWKQNDSGLFGRRSDMLAKYLHRSGRFRRILHFDLPMSIFDLRNMARAHHEGAGTTGAMQARGSIARAIGLADEPGFSRGLMLTHSLANATVLAGQRTHDATAFADYVLARMREHGMDPATTLAWVCPVVWGFGALARQLNFGRVVVDLIDDQRSWAMDPPRQAQMEAEYAATLAVADLVLTNCAGNRDRFLSQCPEIHVVPNGAEFDAPVESRSVPISLAALPGPVLGYVGNIRNRVDWDLIAAIASARPAWSIALLGPLDNPEAMAAMKPYANVHLLGPVDYETMRACLRHFDVAIVPHRADAMTDAMNPLKIYNYLAAGRPVVATAIANMEDVRDLIAVAPDAPGFITAVEKALVQEAPQLDPHRAAALSWSGRTAQILRLLDGPSDAAGDEGQDRDGQARRLVADHARDKAERREPLQEIGAEVGVDK